jgi:hypothetical protein
MDTPVTTNQITRYRAAGDRRVRRFAPNVHRVVVTLPSVNEAAGRVIRVWSRGRVFPLCTAVVLAGIVIALRLLSLRWFNALRDDTYLLIGIAVLAVGAAFGRKLTLTTDKLTMRQFNGAKSVDLANIVLIVRARPGILRPPFLQPVWIKLASGNWRRSKALGWFKDEGIEVIKQAVRAAGGHLERDEPVPARFGPSALTDPGPVLRTWSKGRFTPTLAALVAAGVLGMAISRDFRWAAEDARFGLAYHYSPTPFEIIPALALVAALVTAAGRKLTLTKNSLVVRKMFGLHRIVIPLDDVVTVHQRSPSRGAPGPWQPVFVELTDGTTISTKSMGAIAGPGVAAVEEAVANAGGRLELARRR